MTAFLIIAAVLLLPVEVYFCVKVGTYAYLRARYLFKKDNQNGKKITSQTHRIRPPDA